MALDDDSRQAAAMKVGISSHIATAALAVMAGALALYTFVASTFQEPWHFHALVFLGLVLLVLSVFVGAKASAAVTAAVRRGEWLSETTSDKPLGSGFNQQSLEAEASAAKARADRIAVELRRLERRVNR